MRKIILICLLLFAVAAAAEANPWSAANSAISADADWVDDALHVFAGGAVAYATGFAVRRWTDNPWLVRSAQIALPLALGALKELADSRFEPRDLAGWGAGAAIVIVVEW